LRYSVSACPRRAHVGLIPNAYWSLPVHLKLIKIFIKNAAIQGLKWWMERSSAWRLLHRPDTDNSSSPPPIFDGRRTAADNLSARHRCHINFCIKLFCNIFHDLNYMAIHVVASVRNRRWHLSLKQYVLICSFQSSSLKKPSFRLPKVTSWSQTSENCRCFSFYFFSPEFQIISNFHLWRSSQLRSPLIEHAGHKSSSSHPLWM